MNSFFKKFKKVGGISLLKQYWQAGVLFYAIIELIRHGTSQKALELLRLSVQFKINQKLKKKYSYCFKEIDTIDFSKLEQKQSNKVWICWLQGMESAPELVKYCFSSIKQNLSNSEIIIITKENYKNYVSFPHFIIGKWDKGIITNTHFSDLLRLELLLRYGGLWLDATVLCSSNKIPDYILDSNLFMYQLLKPGLDGHILNVSTWLISACSNNKIIYSVKALLYEYWKKNDIMIDYFLIHHFFALAIEQYHEEWSHVFPYCNSIPHILQLNLFEQYNENLWETLSEINPFHKLTYKLNEKQNNLKSTYFEKIIREKIC